MKLSETKIPGAFVVEPEPHRDERGFFARVFDAEEFAARGLARLFVQCSISHNDKRGTLRGMHYQTAPHAEEKLVRCTMGAVWDVVLDLRAESPTFKQWFAVELSAENRRALYVPRGVAHGFQTLADHSELYYEITPEHRAEAASGVRYDDRAFGIDWPLPVSVVSERDRTFANFEG